jgi:predicted transcriptional regulator
MALKPKSAVFQVRIDPDLYARFKSLCDSQNMTVSDFVRRSILSHVERDDFRRQQRELVQSKLERKPIA